MTIQECYKEMGGDFEGVQKRFGVWRWWKNLPSSF